jgi:integration host factor subunit alpha
MAQTVGDDALATDARGEAQSLADLSRRTATRADLLDAVYDSCPNLSRAQARDVFEMALEEIAETLTRGESVKLRSFGLFTVREKRERIGRNPRTGVEVPITPRRVLTFRPSPVLLAVVNGEVATEKDKD